MQISSNYNLPVLVNDRLDPRQGQTGRQQQERPLRAELVEYQQNNPQNSPVRPPVFVQPLFDQRVSHRGELALDTYRGVALTGETEILNRLDVMA